MAKLNVNIDHCATLREVRRGRYPDPVWAATIAELAGADGITVHLREDRRHIQDNDVKRLKKSVQGVLNLEMALTAEMLDFARDIKPDVITIVPEKREELTTEGGLDLKVVQKSSTSTALLAELVTFCDSQDIALSLFIDPETDTINRSLDMGVRHIELHTGKYANARRKEDKAKERVQLLVAARHAAEQHMFVAAGHGLNYKNTAAIVAASACHEYNIGHAIMAQALLVGMKDAVRDMVNIVRPVMPTVQTMDSIE